MTSQQAAAMLHAAGITSPNQWIHFHEGDGGDEGYTAAMCLLEAAGLAATVEVTASAGGRDTYYTARFETDGGAITLTSPYGLPSRDERRMVMTPAVDLASRQAAAEWHEDDRVALTPQGVTLAAVRESVKAHGCDPGRACDTCGTEDGDPRVYDLALEEQRDAFAAATADAARAWRDGDPHDEAAS